MNIDTKKLLDNKLSDYHEDLMIKAVKEIVLLLCDNVELKFEENDKDSINNISDLLYHFYRVFLAQAYITENLPFNVLEFYAVFLNKHLQEADTYDYRSYNLHDTFKKEFKQFIKDKNVFKSESENT